MVNVGHETLKIEADLIRLPHVPETSPSGKFANPLILALVISLALGGPAAAAGVGADASARPARRVTLGDFMDDLPVGALHRFVVWVIGITTSSKPPRPPSRPRCAARSPKA